jgi:hypothetical protein
MPPVGMNLTNPGADALCAMKRGAEHHHYHHHWPPGADGAKRQVRIVAGGTDNRARFSTAAPG